MTADTPGDCFSLFVIADIVKYTNQRIDTKVDSLFHVLLASSNLFDKFQYFIQHTDQLEMKAFIGLCYMTGLQKENYSDCDILWEDGIGHLISAATISKERFKFLNRLI